MVIIAAALIGSFLFYVDYMGKQFKHRRDVYKLDFSEDSAAAIGPQQCSVIVAMNDYTNCTGPGILVPLYNEEWQIVVPSSGGEFGGKTVRFRCITPASMDIETKTADQWIKTGTLDCGSFFAPI